MIQKLYTEGLCSILIEGGKKILENCIKENLWDEIRVFSSAIKLKEGIKGPKIDYKKFKCEKIGTDRLIILHNESVIRKIEQSF
jgi:diaminohydroxyphosphoribosylaminopyrimidine deaminase/5-amino-6-(5-phosphoribosylamino)uracil reductase